jgi:hypothetical protein
MVMNLGPSVPVSTCQIEQNRMFFPPGVLIGPSTSYTTPYAFSDVRVTSSDKTAFEDPIPAAADHPADRR